VRLEDGAALLTFNFIGDDDDIDWPVVASCDVDGAFQHADAAVNAGVKTRSPGHHS
jgi:hypothetical protein